MWGSTAFRRGNLAASSESSSVSRAEPVASRPQGCSPHQTIPVINPESFGPGKGRRRTSPAPAAVSISRISPSE